MAKTETRQTTVSALQPRLLSERLEARSADLLLTVLMAGEEIGATDHRAQHKGKQIRYPSILSQLVSEELGLWGRENAMENVSFGNRFRRLLH